MSSRLGHLLVLKPDIMILAWQAGFDEHGDWDERAAKAYLDGNELAEFVRRNRPAAGGRHTYIL